MSLPPPPGYYVPAVLFFARTRTLDVPATQAHVLRLARGGVTGILVQGSNGEAQHLSHEERRAAIALTRRTLDEGGFQHVLVIAGTGAQSTRETKKLCVDAKEAGASHVLVLTPSTWPPQMGVADASPIPYMIYNFPVVTAGIDLDSDTIATLAQHPNIVGTKLSCGQIGKLQRLASTFPSTEFAEGNFKDAMALQARLGHADWAMQKLGGISGVKAVVSKNFGYGVPHVRGPLKPLAG
ncbi:hypothetical protein B0H14DRAFT_2665677 [Mycena olivaceomarginata]|nr:hypothetical protein B0H14DRAFT_2665677 [Mycena olivaceomarginata]